MFRVTDRGMWGLLDGRSRPIDFRYHKQFNGKKDWLVANVIAIKISGKC